MINKLLISTLFIVGLVACSGKKEEDKSQYAPPKEDKPTASLEEHPGKPLFKQHCSVCHQIDGSGVPGMYPPLTESEYVQGNVKWLVSAVVKGLEGPLIVKGTEYNSLMPGLPYLNDAEIAHILTYLRKSFGNSASEVSEEEVNKIRGELK